jgi:MoaA/NifB/PqqE/SkfB family radical SAM enzyme
MTLPAISTIEFTNACNFSCPYCQRTDEDGIRKVGMLSVELVEEMVKRGDFNNTLYCEFQQNGEPTIHPRFTKLVKLIKGAVPYVGLSTNGTYHKFSNSDLILEGLRACDCVTLSIHKETTQYDVDNMVEVLYGHSALRIQTLNGIDYGLNLRNYGIKYSVFVDNYDIREFRHEYGEPKACLDPQASVTIQWDGDVVACCNVVGKQRVYGNVKYKPLQEIWLTAEKTMFPYCKTCRTPSPYARRLNFLHDTLNS